MEARGRRLVSGDAAMIFGLLKRRAAAEPTPAERIYAGLVLEARRPEFYRDLAVPDTLPGRFELIVLHAVLYLRRLRSEGPEAAARAQEVVEEMFRSLDASLREMGVGDLSVGKKMKPIIRAFYDGAAQYDAALDRRDVQALAATLRRIVYRDDPAAADAPDRLAAYVILAADALQSQPAEGLIGVGPAFPAIQEAAP